MMRFAATNLFRGSGAVLSDAAVVTEGSHILDIESDVGTALRSGNGRRLLIPALINAHDHARPSSSSFGAGGMPLENWILRTVLGTPPDPYLVAASALARAARSGCAGMMIHYTRPSGAMSLIDETRGIARAAADVGLRVGFAIAIRDQNPLVYGESKELLSALPSDTATVVREMYLKPALSAAEYIALSEEISRTVGNDMFDVQFGPAGIQWCSKALLEAVAEASARTGRRVHMHLLETIYQRRWADQHYPRGIVRYLKDIGLLSPRLTVAHCVHATLAELEIIAESGARLVTNFGSNLHLKSGIAPIGRARRCGCSVCVGVDGLALDEDDDILREMRLVHLVHGGQGFEASWTPAEFFSAVIQHGRAAIGAPGDGKLKRGAPADFTLLDYDMLDRDAIMAVNPLDLLVARGNSAVVRDLVVAGRVIVRDRVPSGVDLPAIETELRERYRANLPRYESLVRGWPLLSQSIAEWFQGSLHCGM
jgi:cytosine/adenosine deaminase-related metal-dependent hydrolase